MRFFLFTCILFTAAQGMEVYLREITIYKTHESEALDNPPEVYFSCMDDREPIMLRKVTEINKKYIYDQEERSITHLNETQCISCKLKEYDFLDADDEYGTIEICEESLRRGASEVKVDGEFVVLFDCPHCEAAYHWSQTSCSTTTSQAKGGSYASGNAEGEGTYASAKSTAYASSADHEKENVTVGSVVLISASVFLIGLVTGALLMKYFSDVHGRQEAWKMRQLDTVWQESQISYEPLQTQPNERSRIL